MYLNIIELAESFGVSEGVIADWISREGLPHTADRDRLLFDRAQVTQWAASRGLAAKTGFLAPGPMATSHGLSLATLLQTGGIWRDVEPGDTSGCFARIIGGLPGVAPGVRQLLAQRLRAPGGVTWAPVGEGWAIPHPGARISLGRDAGLLSLVLLRAPLSLPGTAVDTTPILRLFFFIAPSPRAHLNLLGRIGRLLTRERPVALLDPVHRTDEEIRAALATSDAAHGSGRAEGGPE